MGTTGMAGIVTTTEPLIIMIGTKDMIGTTAIPMATDHGILVTGTTDLAKGTGQSITRTNAGNEVMTSRKEEAPPTREEARRVANRDQTTGRRTLMTSLRLRGQVARDPAPMAAQTGK